MDINYVITFSLLFMPLQVLHFQIIWQHSDIITMSFFKQSNERIKLNISDEVTALK